MTNTRAPRPLYRETPAPSVAATCRPNVVPSGDGTATFSPGAEVERVELGGWPHVRLYSRGFARLMAADCAHALAAPGEALPKLAFSMNGQALSLTAADPRFRAAMEEADYLQADGQSLVFASRWLTPRPLPERIATTDFFHDAARIAQEVGLRFFFLGASETINAKAAAEVHRLYPRLRIVGRRDGYFTQAEEEAVCRQIVDANTDVLWVGLGKPKEQLFCVHNRDRLRGVAWIKTCGGLFDFLGGRNRRAPKWMQKSGLEWLHRTCSDPKRFLWRYLTTNIHCLYLLLRHRRAGSQLRRRPR